MPCTSEEDDVEKDQKNLPPDILDEEESQPQHHHQQQHQQPPRRQEKSRRRSTSTTAAATVEKKQQMKWEAQQEVRKRIQKNKLSKQRSIALRDPNVVKVQDALEHIVVAGMKVRRDDWRRSVYEKSTRNILVDPNVPQQVVQGDNNNTTAGNDIKRTKYVHAEDVRIYGNGRTGKVRPSHRGFSMNDWPSSSTETNDDEKYIDSEWNVEHGDSIPQPLFNLARLSQEYPTEEQQQMLDTVPASMKSIQTTDISLNERAVPRALIQRCWERAVHVASNSMFASVSKNSTAILPTPAIRIHEPLEYTELSQTEKKCQSLGIAIEGIDERKCPQCTRIFSTPTSLALHYYGNQTSEGCCQTLVRRKRLEAVDKLLQHHVETQIDHILDIVTTSAAAGVATAAVDNQNEDDTQEKDATLPKPPPQQQRQQQQQLFLWTDVFRFLKGAVDDATVIQAPAVETKHPVLETLQTNQEDGMNPLVLNPMIIDVLNRRLIDRYADISR
jgi:hypothetical protein